MKKVLLLIEDYNELIYVETMLKKIGLDVIGMQKEVGLSEKLLSFSPDLIVATAFGEKIRGELLPKKIKKGSKTKLILVSKKKLPENANLEGLGVSAFVNSPINLADFFLSLEKIGFVDAEDAMDKINVRKQQFSNGDESQNIQSKDKLASDEHKNVKSEKEKVPVPVEVEELLTKAQMKAQEYKLNDPDRMKSYSKYLDKLGESKFNGLNPKLVEEQVKDFRAVEDHPEVHEIDEERKEFVTAMFELAKKTN